MRLDVQARRAQFFFILGDGQFHVIRVDVLDRKAALTDEVVVMFPLSHFIVVCLNALNGQFSEDSSLDKQEQVSIDGRAVDVMTEVSQLGHDFFSGKWMRELYQRREETLPRRGDFQA
jgi:hypothetical protein